MTTRTFTLWILWFRFLRFVRMHVRRVQNFVRGAAPTLHQDGPRLMHWLRCLLLTPFWISFELVIGAWELMEREVQRRKMRLRTYHRALFCVALSLTVGQAMMILLTRVHPSEWTFVISILCGLAMFFFWKRGARWLRKTLGVRPMRSRDPNSPYAGMDFGN